jgi:hypothetical protein
MSFTKKLLSFWIFTRVQSSVFCVKSSHSGNSISSWFLIFWTMIKNLKGFESKRSSWSFSSQNQDLSLWMCYI